MEKMVTFLGLLFISSTVLGAVNPLVADESGRFKIAGNMTSDQQKIIQDDFHFLNQQQFPIQDQDLNNLLHLEKADGPSLSNWLAERVQYIIGENFDEQSSLQTLQLNYSYENPGLQNEFEGPGVNSVGVPISEPSPSKAAVSNLGEAIYSDGKNRSALFGLWIPGGDLVSVTSPRTGIIQIGELLFRNLDLNKNKNPLESTVNVIYRLASYFHEARHSDGNGRSLGFLHARCPNGHLFANLPTCDRNLNGAYTVGALITRLFARNCKDCSSRDLELLKLIELDYFSRVIKETPNNSSLDSANSANMESDQCAFVSKHPKLGFTPEFIKFCAAKKAAMTPISSSDSTPSSAWDETPEGKR